VDDTLQALPGVFAAGDCAVQRLHPRPRAGVFAVKQGMPLARNLRRALRGVGAMETYVPQRAFLGILGTGGGAAVALSGEAVLEGAWVWALKEWLDRGWMAGYSSQLPLLPLPDAGGGEAAELGGMRCAGCGSKVAASVLDGVLRDLELPTRPEVVVGLTAPDDCALVRPPGGAGNAGLLVQTVDFFTSFCEDEYVFAQICANHALSDVHAMGAEAVTCLCVAMLPLAAHDKLRAQLSRLLKGACGGFRPAGRQGCRGCRG
jgi:selenide,water dikinase